MRVVAFTLLLSLFAVAGCGGKPNLRAEAIEFKGTVKFPAGVSPQNLTITFQPTQNTLPTTAKLAADGSFTAKAEPGSYVFFFSEEQNGNHPSFKRIPEKFRSGSTENPAVVAPGANLSLEVK